MSRENTKYVIIPLSKVEDVDFDQVMQTSVRTLRLSEDGEYTFVKFEGNTPSFLEEYTQYNHSEMIAILKNASGIWHIDDDEALTWRETVSDFVNTITWSKFNPFNWF
tara:strand:- start:587 stop:910 length:324 start_codon:yes stop_codon:yes gene_type:complete